MAESHGDEWLDCTGCGKHLAKKIEGRKAYEVKHKKRRSIVVMSTEICPRCGTANPIPPAVRTGTQNERPEQAQVIQRPSEARPQEA